MPPYILLDLNYTLVSNSEEKRSPFARQVENEQYRQDLLKSLQGLYVILITARPIKYQEVTLQSLSLKTGWLPDESFFNDLGYWPPAFKKSILDRFLSQRKLHFLGIESNPKTRAMYLNNGIESCPYDKFILDPEKWLNPQRITDRPTQLGLSINP